MRAFDADHRKVHYPEDLRFRIRAKESSIIVVILLVPITITWIQFLFFGLPSISVSPAHVAQGEPHGFPAWIRLEHFVNFFFLMLLVRSGLPILMDHPRLYWNRNCTPKTDWIKFTPIAVPLDRVWTAKEDARYISSARRKWAKGKAAKTKMTSILTFYRTSNPAPADKLTMRTYQMNRSRFYPIDSFSQRSDNGIEMAARRRDIEHPSWRHNEGRTW